MNIKKNSETYICRLQLFFALFNANQQLKQTVITIFQHLKKQIQKV